MPKAKKEMSMLKRFTIKYSFEFVVIILGILISLLLEQKRQNEIEINRKNNTIKQVEKIMGQKFGDPENPLLVSIRSGARQSMPGMMETVLNVGLTIKTIPGLIE